MIHDVIGDGYDLAGLVSHMGKTVRFCYRPMLKHERDQVIRLAAHLGGRSGEELVLMAAANHVSNWSLDYPPDMTGMEGLEQRYPVLWQELWMIVCGVRSPDWEKESAENLRQGVELIIKNPAWAMVTCVDCRRLWLDSNGRQCNEGGVTLLRLANQPVLCETSAGCPAGHYDKPKRLSMKNVRAYNRHMEFKAAGCFPRDAIVLRNAAIIEDVLTRAKSSGPQKAAG